MPDTMNGGNNVPLEPPLDRFEEQIDELWASVLEDFGNDSLHQEMIDLARKYFLLERVARHYQSYLAEHPADEAAKRYQNEIVTQERASPFYPHGFL